MSEHRSLPQLLDMLSDYVEKKETGTLYINSDCKHVITFALDKGRISSMFFGPKRGRKAIEPIRGITGGTFHFEAAGLAMLSQDIPVTEEILEQLRAAGTAAVGAGGEAAGGAMASVQVMQFQQELKRLLTTHMGPIAGMIFDDCCEGATAADATPEAARALVGRLAAEIDEASEAERFRTDANNLIERMMAG